jgi:hypothetical protein
MYRPIPRAFARIGIFIAAVLAGPTAAIGQASTEARAVHGG